MTEVTSDLIVRVKHVRAARLCMKGARVWWARNDLDWSDFTKNGIPAEKLVATGDPYAQLVVDIARAEQDGRT